MALHPLSYTRTRKTCGLSAAAARMQTRRFSKTDVRTAIGCIQRKLHADRGVLENVPHQYAQVGAHVSKALGY